MDSALRRLFRTLEARRADVVLAAVSAVVILTVDSRSANGSTFAWVVAAVAANVFAVVFRSRQALVAGVVLALVLGWVGLRAPDATLDGWVDLLDWVVLLVAYSVGTSTQRWRGLGAVVLLALGLQCSSASFNPLYEMVTIGPWLAGRAVLSRRRLNAQVAARNQQLADERPRFVAETVRLERALVARELHDLVAHNVTVIVIQATAGQRLATRGDIDGVRDALAGIEQAVRRARDEVGRLTSMLHGSLAVDAPGLEAVDVLVRGVAASGALVRYEAASDLLDRVSPATSQTLYRLVQESLSNAMKHAPGSPLDVCISRDADVLVAEVTNGPAPATARDVAIPSGGFGLAGMRARVEDCGGTLSTGGTPDGGWRVVAELPTRLPSQPAADQARRRLRGRRDSLGSRQHPPADVVEPDRVQHQPGRDPLDDAPLPDRDFVEPGPSGQPA